VRSLPALFVAILVAFVAAATALMTDQLGIDAWPTAPAPQIGTRVVAPPEEVAVERVTTAKRGSEHVRRAETSGRRGRSGAPGNATGRARSGALPRRASRVRPQPRRNDGNARPPAAQPPAPAPAAPPPADPVAPARNDVVPSIPVAPPSGFSVPPSRGHGQGRGGQHGHEEHGGGNHGGGPGRGHGFGRHQRDDGP
jgi:hypothetical protein